MVLTTLVYLIKDHQVLLMNRNKKENDINLGKWIAVGGKLNPKESPRECAIRETYEETGYVIHDLRYVGMVTFPELVHGEDEIMFIYVSHHFSGELHETDEGDLMWIDLHKVNQLPTWPADHYYLEWINDRKIHEAKVIYKDGELISFIDETRGDKE